MRTLIFLFFAAPAFAGDYSTDVLTRETRQAAPVNASLAPTASHRTTDDAFRYLAGVAAQRGYAVQCEIVMNGRAETYVATPDGQVMVKRSVAPAPQTYTAPRPEVAAGRPFLPEYVARGLFPKNHQCPNCAHISAPDTGNWIIRGGDPDGRHSHRCEKCGYVGVH